MAESATARREWGNSGKFTIMYMCDVIERFRCMYDERVCHTCFFHNPIGFGRLHVAVSFGPTFIR